MQERNFWVDVAFCLDFGQNLRGEGMVAFGKSRPSPFNPGLNPGRVKSLDGLIVKSLL